MQYYQDYTECNIICERRENTKLFRFIRFKNTLNHFLKVSKKITIQLWFGI